MANFCGECGSQVSTAVKFCPECGIPVTATTSVISTPASSAPVSTPPLAVPVVVHEEHHTLACPSCYKVDAVQKVSTVVGHGASAISLSGGFGATTASSYATTMGGMHLAGGSRTFQSRMLAPPSAPEYISPWKGIVGSLILGVIAIFFGVGFIAAMLNSAFVAIVWLLLLPGWPIYKVLRTSRQAVVAKQTYEDAVPRWREAMRRWEQLYYCFRCDGAFIPGDSGFIPTSGVTNFIFRSAALS